MEKEKMNYIGNCVKSYDDICYIMGRCRYKIIISEEDIEQIGVIGNFRISLCLGLVTMLTHKLDVDFQGSHNKLNKDNEIYSQCLSDNLQLKLKITGIQTEIA